MKTWLQKWLLTARLWALFWGRTPRHPLFVMRFRHLAPIRHRPPWLNSVLVTVLGTFLVLTMFVWIQILVVLFFALILCIPFGGTLRGLVFSVEVARGIHREGQDSARMALFQMMPPGQLGIAWLLGVRAVRLSRANRTFTLVIRLAQWLVGGATFLFAGIGLVSIMTALIDSNYATQSFYTWRAWIFPILGSGVIILWMVVDNLQAPILGVLCGLWGAATGSRTMVASAVAIGVYLTLMFSCALGTSLLIGLVGALTLSAPNSSLWVYIATWLMFPVITVGLREMAIRRMWTLVRRRMNADGSELRLI